MGFALRALDFLQGQGGTPIIYKGVRLGTDYVLDLLVEDTVIVEIKSVRELLAVHRAQLLTYLKLTGRACGLLMNFNVPVLKQGIRRVLNTVPSHI